MNKIQMRFGAASLVFLLACGAYASEPVEPEQKQGSPERQVTITKGKVAAPPMRNSMSQNPDGSVAGMLGTAGEGERAAGNGRAICGVPLVNKPATVDDDEVYTVTERCAEFPGGTKALTAWLGEHLHYPEEAWKAKVQGRVVVSFIVEKDGSISSPQIMRSVSPALDAEALRVIGEMPAWIPGKKGGKAVRSRYLLPVEFKITEQDK